MQDFQLQSLETNKENKENTLTDAFEKRINQNISSLIKNVMNSDYSSSEDFHMSQLSQEKNISFSQRTIKSLESYRSKQKSLSKSLSKSHLETEIIGFDSSFFSVDNSRLINSKFKNSNYTENVKDSEESDEKSSRSSSFNSSFQKNEYKIIQRKNLEKIKTEIYGNEKEDSMISLGNEMGIIESSKVDLNNLNDFNYFNKNFEANFFGRIPPNSKINSKSNSNSNYGSKDKRKSYFYSQSKKIEDNEEINLDASEKFEKFEVKEKFDLKEKFDKFEKKKTSPKKSIGFKTASNKKPSDKVQKQNEEITKNLNDLKINDSINNINNNNNEVKNLNNINIFNFSSFNSNVDYESSNLSQDSEFENKGFKTKKEREKIYSNYNNFEACEADIVFKRSRKSRTSSSSEVSSLFNRKVFKTQKANQTERNQIYSDLQQTNFSSINNITNSNVSNNTNNNINSMNNSNENLRNCSMNMKAKGNYSSDTVSKFKDSNK